VKADEVEFVAEVARAGAGLSVERDKLYVIESRLAPVARREGFGSIRDLLLAARHRREGKLMWAVVEAMAGGETSFFRDPAIFARFRDEMLPELARRRGRAPVRVWSAGCGGGQEAYSLAFAVDDASASSPVRNVDILGSDLSERALEKARSGLYTQFEVQRGLPIRTLVQHFDKQDELWALSARIQAMVRWKRVNLNADFGGLGRFEAIFCRNVLWAMEPAAHDRALQRLAGALEPGGYLVLGMEETADSLGEAFTVLERGVYRLDPGYSAAA
jgi:chemotaxis protein methyltransferase CheR